MPWLKVSDTSAFHSQVLAVASTAGADSRSINEIFGFVTRLAAQSAGGMTDYAFNLGTAFAVGGTDTQRLLSQAQEAGLIIPTEVPGMDYQVVVDEDLFHIRSKAEIEHERKNKRDTYVNNPVALLARLRDGDECRWCGVVTQPLGRKTARSLTLDHLIPGIADSASDLVVSCLKCNSKRRDNIKGWARNHELREVPKEPLYCSSTARTLSKNGYKTEPNYGPGAHSGSSRPKELAGASSESHSDGLSRAQKVPGSPNGCKAKPHQRPVAHSVSNRPKELAGASSQSRSDGLSRARKDKTDPQNRLSPGGTPPGDDPPQKPPDQVTRATNSLSVKVFGSGEKGSKTTFPGSGRERNFGKGQADSGRAGSGRTGVGSGRAGSGKARTGRAGKGRAGKGVPSSSRQRTSGRRRRGK